MKTSAQLRVIYDLLLGEYGPSVCPLSHRNVFELLCAVMLSAQCRDERVNAVTPALFDRFPTPEKLAAAAVSEVEPLIQSLGLAHAKAIHLIGAAERIQTVFGGRVPDRMEDLVSLPGVGRKTANVVLGNGFGIPGFPVDTHVKRLSNRIGILHSDSPEKIEAYVNRKLAPEFWTDFSHLLIRHGRKVCSARAPRCADCAIHELCNYGKGKKS